MLLRPRLSCEPQVLSCSLPLIIAVCPLLPCLKHSPLSGNPFPVLRACLCSFHLLQRFLSSLSTKVVHKPTPTAISRQPVAPPNPQQQFGTGIRLVDSSSQQQQPSIFGSSNLSKPSRQYSGFNRQTRSKLVTSAADAAC